MAKLKLSINSKEYQIGCNEQEVSKLESCAEILSSRINKIKEEDPKLFMGLNNELIFLLQALTLIDELNSDSKQEDNIPTKVVNDKLNEATKTAKKILQLQKNNTD